MKNKSQRIGLSVIAILLVSSFLHGQIKIMPLGDSITWGITYVPGVSTDEGYRGFLFDNLSNAGYNFDFIGGLQNGNSLTDKDHEGHPAWYANKPCGSGCSGPGIAAAVNGFLTANPPEIVLLHIGTNDLILMDGNPATNTIPGLVDDIELIITNIHNYDSNIIIIVALIVNSAHNANITSLTTQLNDALSASLTQSNTLRIVDMEIALTYPDDIVTDDVNSHLVHPNENGYEKMADVWFDELKFVIDNLLPVELTSFIGVGTNLGITLKWNTATEVNNYGFEIERKTIENKTTQMSSDWETIGFVEGYGNSNSPKSYSFLDKSLVGSNSFYYRLKQIDNDGQYEYSQIIEVELTPNDFELKQNYPNPFNPTTTIEYYIPEREFVNLSIFNTLGEQVENLVNMEQGEGRYQIEFNAGNLASGFYYYKISAGSNFVVKKLILLK